MSIPIQSNRCVHLLAPSATAQSVQKSDSGKHIIIPAATAAGTINLPTAVGNAGLKYRFIMSATAAYAITLLPAGGTISGPLFNVTAAFPKAAAANVKFTALAIAGDAIELISDDKNWYCTGQSGVVGFA